ncbi:carbohydrate ABC transporter permease [Cellulomonas sp. KRMCY2]|uniref:carbohydrate ABC transporter permease n=1 Tax=Cellulomonas sp. KRMCY2 TaxID=1304865 RepID=UPI00045EC4A2|nr:carbohydrate ABC transporter permease [Cellulomonas sp. KRMCY2]
MSTRTTARSAAASVSFHLVSSILAIAFLFPLLWAIINSLKTPEEANQAPPTLFPTSLSLGNFQNLMDYGSGLPVYFWNSILISFLTVVGTVVVSVLGGYGFARFDFWGKKHLFVAVVAILMVPYATILLPLYILLGKLGLQNSLIGLSLVLVMFQLPFSILMMRNSFESVPRELEEAALVDGCSNVGALRHISLRMVSPGIVTVALFAFLASWNEFLAPLIFLNDASKFTLPIMLVNVRSGSYGAIDYGALQAGVVIAMVPALVLYLVLQRYYVNGLLNGALKS